MGHLQFNKLFPRDITLAIFLIFSLGLLIYSNSFQGEFCSDDYTNIVENPSIKDITDLGAIWKAFNTRFLVGVSFAFNYWMGSLKPLGYHVENLGVHLLASILVYGFVRISFLTPVLTSSPLKEHKGPIALFASLIFLCHPVQTQAVSYITQRSVSMATVCYLSTLIFYITARLEDKRVYLIGAVLCMIAGMFCKEMIVTLPVTLFFYEVFFLGLNKENFLKRLKDLSPFIFLACLLPVLLLQDKGGSVLSLIHQVKGQPFQWEYFLTEINVLRTYLRLLFVPVNLSHSYDYPIAESILEVGTIVSIVLLSGLVISIFKLFKKNRLISFSILFFFIATSVEAVSVCFVHKGVIYEHWLYLAVVGFSVFLPVLLWDIVRTQRNRKIILVVILSIFCVLTYQRNRVWQTCEALWQDVLQKASRDQLPYVNLGLIYSRQQDLDKAIFYYTRAIDLNREMDDFRLSQVYVNLAAAYGRKGDYPKEIEYSRKAIELNPYNGQAYNNLSLAYALMGQFGQALEYGLKAVELSANDAGGYNNLGLLYIQFGEVQKARQALEKALELNPDHHIAAQNLKRLNRQAPTGK